MRAVRSLLFGWAIAGLTLPIVGVAQPYPERPVKVVVPYTPGGGSDVLARVLSDGLQQRLGQAFVVENRPGASGNIGLEYAARSAPDGYTIVLNPSSIAVTPTLLGAKFDPIRDFTPIVMLGRATVVIGGHASLPVKSLADFIAYVRDNKDKRFYASCGMGGPDNLAMEALKLRANIELTHVPFNGCGGMIPDVLAGRIPFYTAAFSAAAPYIQAGTLRPFVVANAKRLSFLPDTPTVVESGYPDFVFENWIGMFGPAGLPSEVVSKLNIEINQLLDRLDVREKLSTQFIETVGGPPDVLKKALAADVPRYAQILKAVGLDKAK